MADRSYWVVMGVSCCGKTTLGKALAQAAGGTFIDADDLHPAANVDKMRRGIPLQDDDRKPWLTAVIAAAQQCRSAPVIIACSSLKVRYRHALRRGLDCRFIHLRIDQRAAEQRARLRSGHFFDPGLIASQFETLEVPQDAITIDADKPIDQQLAALLPAMRDGT